jgi:hypothetical protein
MSRAGDNGKGDTEKENEWQVHKFCSLNVTPGRHRCIAQEESQPEVGGTLLPTRVWILSLTQQGTSRSKQMRLLNVLLSKITDGR